jgi:hypothetical protein
MTAMRKERSERYQSGERLLEDLRSVQRTLDARLDAATPDSASAPSATMPHSPQVLTPARTTQADGRAPTPRPVHLARAAGADPGGNAIVRECIRGSTCSRPGSRLFLGVNIKPKVLTRWCRVSSGRAFSVSRL